MASAFKLLVPLLAALPLAAGAASFDCAKARSYSEKLVCSTPDLSRADEELGRIYRRAKQATGNSKDFRQLAEDFWKKRERCRDEQCVRNWYQGAKAAYETIIQAGDDLRAAPKPEADDGVLGGIVPGVTSAAEMRRILASIGCGLEADPDAPAGSASSVLIDVKSGGPCLPFTAKVMTDDQQKVLVVALLIKDDSEAVLQKIESKYRARPDADGVLWGYYGRTGVRIVEKPGEAHIFFGYAPLVKKMQAESAPDQGEARARARAEGLF